MTQARHDHGRDGGRGDVKAVGSGDAPDGYGGAIVNFRTMHMTMTRSTTMLLLFTSVQEFKLGVPVLQMVRLQPRFATVGAPSLIRIPAGTRWRY